MNAKNTKPAFNQNEYNNDYKRQHYDRICLNVPKGMKADMQGRAARLGLSLQGYVVELVYSDLQTEIGERLNGHKPYERPMNE